MILSIFSCVCWPLVYLPWRNVCSGPLPTFKLRCLGIFVVVLWFFLCVFWVVGVLNFLIRYMICKCFPPFCRLPFHSVDCVLWCTVFYFDIVQFIYTFLCFYLFIYFSLFILLTLYLRNCQFQRHEAFPPMFSSKRFILLALRSLCYALRSGRHLWTFATVPGNSSPGLSGHWPVSCPVNLVLTLYQEAADPAG